MRARAALLGICFFVLTLAACGPTVGDPCTTTNDCGGQVCINDSYAPGGYCSRACTIGDERSCPVGTLCIPDALAAGTPACFKVCTRIDECRDGYECKVVRDSRQAVCVGTSGL
jgi:hypothetical protein